MTLLKRKYDPKSREMHDVAPFTEICPYYDEIHTDVNYHKLSLHLVRLAQHHHVNVRMVTDIGCRTGLLLHHLAERGFEVTGVETTQQMVDWAAGFADYKAVPVSFYLSNMKQKLPFDNQDMVLCLHQNMNYFHNQADLELFLSMVRMMVAPKGLFVFDLLTEIGAQQTYGEYLDYDKVMPGFYVHKAYYIEDRSTVHHMYEMYPHNVEIMYVENHYQFVWKWDDLKRIVEDGGFKIESVNAWGQFHPHDEENDRTMMVTCRPK
ncbi:methyltransferase domain-containing protein [bacterium]|nr:methyltransferase domain-containing protein [bacterium]